MSFTTAQLLLKLVVVLSASIDCNFCLYDRRPLDKAKKADWEVQVDLFQTVAKDKHK